MNQAPKPRRHLAPIIAALAVLLAITGVWWAVAKRTQTGSGGSGSVAKLTVAQWGQERYLIYLPLYVAMEEGYFRDEGLDVQLIFTGNDDQTFAAVVGGSAQFGVGDPAFAAISTEKGLDAKVIATVVGGVAIWGVTNNEAVKSISQAADLAGLRVGTFPAPSTNFTLMRALIDSEPKLKDTKIVEAGIGAQIALLEGKSADIAMVLEPAASIAESQGYRVVYSSPKFHGPFLFTGVTTTTEYLKSNSDTAIRFVRALQRAVVTSHTSPDVAVRVGVKLFPSVDAKVVERAVRRMIDEQTLPKHARVDETAWRALMDVRVKAGDIKSALPMPRVVDNTFADAAGRP